MSGKAELIAEAPETKRRSSFTPDQIPEPARSPSPQPRGGFPFLQRAVGNQALLRLFEPGIIQAKLVIGSPDDIYEQEADRMADQVMRMPDGAVGSQQPVVDGKGEFDGLLTADGGLKRGSLQLKSG